MNCSIALGIWGAAFQTAAARGRRAARRRADERVQCFVELLHKRPRGRDRPRARPVPAAREPCEISTTRHFDAAGGEASITAGLMLLVYAMTRLPATARMVHNHGDDRPARRCRCARRRIRRDRRLRSKSAAPPRCGSSASGPNDRTSNVSGLLLAGAVFSQFFLLTLYMHSRSLALLRAQDRRGLHVTLTVSIIGLLEDRPGIGDAHRHPPRLLTAGLAAGPRAGSSCTRSCPCTGGSTSGICSRRSC